MALPVALRAPCVAIYSGILSAVNSSIGMLFLTRGWVKFGLPQWVIFRLPFPKGVGFVDVHLLASAQLTGVTLWTADKRLESAADQLELTFRKR